MTEPSTRSDGRSAPGAVPMDPAPKRLSAISEAIYQADIREARAEGGRGTPWKEVREAFLP